MVITIITAKSNSGWALPFPDLSLHKMINSSTVILEGYVMKLTKDEQSQKQDYLNASIKVLSVIKGSYLKDTIVQRNYLFISCPKFPQFYDSTYVLLFLDIHPVNKKLQIVGFHNGAKTMSKEQMELYKARIKEALALYQIKNPQKKLEQLIEWQVKCMEAPALINNTNYELSDQNQYAKFFPKEDNINISIDLTLEQYNRLKYALFHNTGKVNFNLVYLVYKGNEREVDRLLIDKLKKYKNYNFELVAPYVSFLKHRNGSIKMKQLLKEYSSIFGKTSEEKKLQEIIPQFIDLIDY